MIKKRVTIAQYGRPDLGLFHTVVAVLHNAVSGEVLREPMIFEVGNPKNVEEIADEVAQFAATEGADLVHLDQILSEAELEEVHSDCGGMIVRVMQDKNLFKH